MRRIESVFAPLISAAVSSAVARSSIALPRLLLIFVPSVPSSSGASDSSASGTGNTAPYRSLNRRADQPGQLDVRQLVLPDWYQRGLAEQDVRRLMDGVGEHQPAHAGLSRVGDLVLHRRVALELRDGDQAEEGEQQLVQGRYRAMREDDRTGWVNAAGQVIQHEAGHVLIEALGAVPVGQYLIVGDQHEDLGPEVLQPDPVVDRAEVVPEVQRPGRPVPGQDRGNAASERPARSRPQAPPTVAASRRASR